MTSGMRRLIVGFSLAAVSVSAMGGWTDAVAQDARRPAVRCPSTEGAIRIDGRLDEWSASAMLTLGEEQLVRRDAQYFGPGDLSGEIFVARDATSLYVAGRIKDDTLFWNARTSFRGDGVELFLDFHPDPDSRAPDDGYDGHTHQLLLHPLAPEVKWNFSALAGRIARPDDPVDGLELAALPLRDEKDATIGYTFELALPLHNLTDEKLISGRVLGFDVALSDSDGLPEQKNYATWSGNEQLSQFPARFGRLVLGENPPEPEAPGHRSPSQSAPLAILLAILGALLFAWLARLGTPGGRRLAGLLEAVRRVRLRTKLIVGAVLVGLLLVTQFGAGWLERRLTRSEVETRRAFAADVLSAAREAGRLRLLEPDPPEDPAPLISLLSGRTLAPPVDYDFTLLPPREEVPHQTLDGIPYLRRDVPVMTRYTGQFLVHPPARAQRATIVYSYRLDDPAARPDADTVVAEFRFVHRDGRVPPPTLLRFGRQVDAFDDPVSAAGATAPNAPEARVAIAWEDADGEARHALALDVELPTTESLAPLVRIEVEPRGASGTLFLHGVAVLEDPAAPPRPLALGRATRTGTPTAAGPFPGADAVLELSRDADWHVLRDLDVRADALWIVTGLSREYAQHRYRARVAVVDIVLDDGSVEGPFALENGVSIDAETAPSRQHAEGYRGEVAYEWGVRASRVGTPT